MNIKQLHEGNKEVSAVPVFKGAGILIAIHLQKGGELKEHITKVPALLLCVSGTTHYIDENNNNIELHTGDYVNIPPDVKHRLEATEESHLVLTK